MDLFDILVALPIMLMITFFIGAPLGLIVIEPLSAKVIYLTLLIICIVLFRIALKWRKTKKGIFLMVFSLLLWLFLSGIGFSSIGA